MRPTISIVRPGVLPAALLLVLAAPARADADETALIVDATHILPRGGVHAGATGVGGELRFLPDENMTGSIGGFAAFGQPGTADRRDVLDVHVQIGMKARELDAFSPFAALGLDVLHVTTHQPERSLRGTTLGVSAQAGILGKVGDRAVYRASIGYLGAIVPGTGDDLGGVVLQVGLGFMLDD